MRRYLALVLIICAFTLTGARHRSAAPAPPPTPSPTPSPTATPALPSVIIYPFTVNGDADKASGFKLAGMFAAQMQAKGTLGVKTLDPKTSIARESYLVNAIKTGADYYVSGYLTPLGDEVALVEQVVSTSSGAIVWSSTAQVLTYGDALTQADTINTVILRHAGRVEAEYRQQQAQNTPPPGPANGATTSIGQLLGIIHNVTHRNSAPRPTLAADKKPQRPIFIVGRGEPSDAMLAAMERVYRVTRSAVSTQNVRDDAATICGTTSNATIASGEAHTEKTRGFPPTTRNVFTLRIFKCDGSVLFTNVNRAGSLTDAVENAVDAYIAAHPSNT